MFVFIVAHKDFGHFYGINIFADYIIFPIVFKTLEIIFAVLIFLLTYESS